MNTNNNSKGFTIIEVVLVLAIAALIFLIVFLAVPALQRSQRDTQRRTDLGRLQTSITNYASNHQGDLPTVDDAYIEKYMKINGDKFGDPKNGEYKIESSGNGPTTSLEFEEGPSALIYYKKGAQCNSDGTFANKGGNRAFALAIVLEDGNLYCENN